MKKIIKRYNKFKYDVHDYSITISQTRFINHLYIYYIGFETYKYEFDTKFELHIDKNCIEYYGIWENLENNKKFKSIIITQSMIIPAYSQPRYNTISSSNDDMTLVLYKNLAVLYGDIPLKYLLKWFYQWIYHRSLHCGLIHYCKPDELIVIGETSITYNAASKPNQKNKRMLKKCEKIYSYLQMHVESLDDIMAYEKNSKNGNK